jgi:hypothetical protein
MRPLVPTSRQRGRGRGTPGLELAVAGAFLALVLAALVGLVDPPATGEAHARPHGGGARVVRGTASRCETSERKPVCVHPRVKGGSEWATVVRASSARASQPHLGSPRGRTGFQPDTQALHRAVRERLEALVTALAQEQRFSAMSGATGHGADRPTIVTRPLRGPPARV